MDEEYYKLDQMVMDAFKGWYMFSESQDDDNNNTEETTTESELHSNVKSLLAEKRLIKEEPKDCEVESCEQLELTTQIEIVKHELIEEEPAAISKCEDALSARKRCYVIVTRLRRSVLEKYLDKQKKVLRKSQSVDTNIQYKCKLCSKEYLNYDLLKTHLKVHVGVKPYKCSVCNKKCGKYNALLMHLWGHCKPKCYKCETCGYSFAKASKLTRHIRIHTRTKHECEMCGKCFTLSRTLTRHLLIHTGEKRYKCETCDKCFTRRDHLTRHLRVHA